MKFKNPVGLFLKKFLCYCLIFQIIFVDIVRASASDISEDHDQASLLINPTLSSSSYGSMEDVRNHPLGSDNDLLVYPSRNGRSSEHSDESSNPLLDASSRSHNNESVAIEIKTEIKKLWRQKTLVEITPYEILIASISISLGITALQAWEALTAAGAFDILGIPKPESEGLGSFYASTAAVHGVIFSGLVPFIYSSIKAGHLVSQGFQVGYEEIKYLLKKVIKHINKEPNDERSRKAWRGKSWSLLALEVFNLVCSSTYSLILVGILKRIEHEYPIFYKIFGPSLGVTTFLDKMTTGHKKALETSRRFQKEPENITTFRKDLRTQALQAKKYLSRVDEESLLEYYKEVFPGYENVLPPLLRSRINSSHLSPDEFDLGQLKTLFQASRYESIEESKLPKVVSALSAMMAWYGLCSVMFQSFETLAGYSWVLYPISIIAGSWIPYVEYEDIKDIISIFKAKVSNWGKDVKRKLIVGLYVTYFSLLMFIAFVYNYSEFDEARHPDEVKHGFSPINRNVAFNWVFTLPLLVFEMLSFTGLQHTAYAALSFVIKGFSRGSITKISSYRERLMALIDSFIEVVDQASEDGLRAVDDIINPLAEPRNGY
jgi:hypothetical protein